MVRGDQQLPDAPVKLDEEDRQRGGVEQTVEQGRGDPDPAVGDRVEHRPRGVRDHLRDEGRDVLGGDGAAWR